MEPMAELAELVVLFAISLVLIVTVLFRSTSADSAPETLARSGRGGTGPVVLRPIPTR